MDSSMTATLSVMVVPRKGDVDRNVNENSGVALQNPSSPARGTWIEIIRW